MNRNHWLVAGRRLAVVAAALLAGGSLLHSRAASVSVTLDSAADTMIKAIYTKEHGQSADLTPYLDILYQTPPGGTCIVVR
ncbi:MAG: hypothetical protein PHR35_01655 [Kiritimatiellae bacterium]|nr:hypothetical protein [Kiritimatiellia bacterium]